MEKEGKFKEIRAVKSFRSRHSTDENHSVNTTKFDSLNNIIFPQSKKSLPSQINSVNIKQQNFFQALNAIQGISGHNNTQNFLSEYSETNANNSKEEKVLRYINNPITKNVIKDGNNLKVSFHKNFSTSINVPYKLNTIFENLLSNIIEIEDDEDEPLTKSKGESDDDLIILPDAHMEKYPIMTTTTNGNNNNNNYHHKASTAEYTAVAEQSESYNSPRIAFVKPFEFDKENIDDLDEVKEVVVNDYKKQLKNNNAPKEKTTAVLQTNTQLGDMLIIDSLMSSSTNFNYNNQHYQMNRRLFTHQCNIDEYSNTSHKEFMKMIKLKTTEKKIPQKYFKSELVDSILSSRTYKTPNKNDINTNLIDRFNKCDDYINDTHHNREDEGNGDADEQPMTPIKIIGKEEEDEGEYQYFNTSHGNNHLSNNISIKAEMVDFITDNECGDDDNDNDEIIETNILNQPQEKQHNNKENKEIVSSFNDLTPIKHLNFDSHLSPNYKPKLKQQKSQLQFKTPSNKRKKFKIFHQINIVKPSPTSIPKNNLQITQEKEVEEDEGQTVYDIHFINNLLSRDSNNKSNSNYITNHPKLKWIYRSNLLDWLMEISEEFAFKRDTFHYAINYIDRYLTKCFNCEKKYLQLIGICSLCIAAKIEEVQIPKLVEYAKATDESYTDQDIIATEKKILTTLQWEIIPITLNTWMNWYICQWDLFLDTFNEMLIKLTKGYTEENVVYFKRPDDKSYYNYRKIAQLIDLCSLGEKSLIFNSRTIIACAILTVLIGLYDEEIVEALILKDLNEMFYVRLMESGKEYVEVYKEFLRQSFNFEWDGCDLGKAFEYVGKFIKFRFNYDVPLIYQVTTTDIENVSDYYVNVIFNRGIMRILYHIRLTMNRI